MIDKLNPPQQQAVTLEPRHALVLAGAGSGKTRVLTTRIAWLIQSGYTSPLGILAVTFTNKASREMMARISAIMPIDTRAMWVGTFHGLCNRLLRAHHTEAGLPALPRIAGLERPEPQVHDCAVDESPQGAKGAEGDDLQARPAPRSRGHGRRR